MPATLFSDQSASYKAFRPVYPAALFDWMAEISTDRTAAWDVGTGNGQAAVPLAERYARVYATDASSQQLSFAEQRENIEYSVALAEQSGLASGSVDVVLAAQAAHWFDLPMFYTECRRVARRKAPMVLVGYGNALLPEPLQQPIHQFYSETIAPFWATGRRHIDTHYRNLFFPFKEVQAPHLHIEDTWDLAHLMGYLDSWSAVAACRRKTGVDPLPTLLEALEKAWGGGHFPVRFPLFIRATIL